ncbi:Shedu immune nuclease family protein [Brevundimonas sp.]|uniref:Shedu immune nuclease family protein n=1 Tax=Brevundimonas sp. TaxID=1871086 RepID=UPI003564A5AD
MASRSDDFRPGPRIGRGVFTAHGRPDGTIDLTYRISDELLAQVAAVDPKVTADNAIMSLLTYDEANDRLVIRPHTTLPGYDFLQPKYDPLLAIELEGFRLFEDWLDDSDDDPWNVLDRLPSGFIKEPDFGLGLVKDLRFIPIVIETAPDVTRLIVSKQRKTEIKGSDFIVSWRDFDELRKAFNRVHTKAVTLANRDKVILAHNTLLAAAAPALYPEKQRPYEPDTVFKVVGASGGAGLSKSDRRAAVDVVAGQAKTLAKEDAPALMHLQREIELVTLEGVIERFSTLLAANRSEQSWQNLFVENPFILRLAFNLPVVAVGDQISVGGTAFSGAGGKIADFLHKNGLTDNLTLIEIKKPGSPLVGSQYRGGVYPPSNDLSGSVTQILDQRYQLQKALPGLKDASNRWDLESYAIKGVVIVGRDLKDKAQKKSFELYRNNLHDVQIITFDELLAKLRHLKDFLSQIPADIAPAGVTWPDL